MSWIFFAISAYFFLALAAVGDKLLLSASVVNPSRYVFLIGAFGGIIGIVLSSLTLLPLDSSVFSFVFPQHSEQILFAAFIAGVLYVSALFSYFSILRTTPASRVVPSIGALIPICSLLLSLAFLGQQFSVIHLAAFFVLLSGTLLVAAEDKKLFSFDTQLSFILIAALLFSAHYIVIKNAYLHLPFLEVLIFALLGFAVAGPTIYAIFGKKYIIEGNDGATSSRQWLFVVTQGVGVTGGGLLQYAIAQGNVVFVNAMQGVQYAFLFLFLWIGGFFFKKLLQESYSRTTVIRKIAGIAVIAAGIAMISVIH